MNFAIRALKVPEDYEQLATLWNFALTKPVTAEELAFNDSKMYTSGELGKDEKGLLIGYDRIRLVAADDAGRLAGYGVSWRAPWTEAGALNHTLIVDPALRKQGIGSRLYVELERWAAGHGASRLNYEVRDDDEDSVKFAEHRSYRIERHSFESVLDLSGFDLQRHNEQAAGLSGHGISLATLKELPGPENERKLYELYKETSFDIPGFTGDYFDPVEWRKWTLELAGSKPEYIIIAKDGDEFAGVAHLLHQEETDSMYHEYTGVRRSYRGKGIGVVLKYKSIELALGMGIRYLRTSNDSLNQPMLHINRDKFGFRPVPGMYVVTKQLTAR